MTNLKECGTPYKYLSIHSVFILNHKKNEFSIVRANIENTEEKINIAKSLYNEENFYFQYHDIKHNLQVVLN